MAYRIAYNNFPENHGKRRRIFTAAFFLLFLLLVYQFWPEGADMLRRAVRAVRNTAAVTALAQFAEDLVRGDSAAEAFSVFLRELVS